MISICIPAYEMHGEGGKMLKQLLESIKMQDYGGDLEVVVSDHTETGTLKDICDIPELNIKYVRFEQSYGKSSANLNNAIQHATGEYIKPMFQDDVFAKTFALTKMAYILDNSDKDWVAAGANHYTETILKTQRDWIPSWHPEKMKELACGVNTIGGPSLVMYRVDKNITFDNSLIWLLDCEFYYRYAVKHGNPGIITSSLFSIRIWPNSVSNTLATEEVRQRELEYVKGELR